MASHIFLGVFTAGWLVIAAVAWFAVIRPRQLHQGPGRRVRSEEAETLRRVQPTANEVDLSRKAGG
jgi:hypothetical protein